LMERCQPIVVRSKQKEDTFEWRERASRSLHVYGCSMFNKVL
jgi:hypothetical protein